MTYVCLIDDSGSTGGAQNFVRQLSWRINMLTDYSCCIHSTKEIIGSDSHYSIIMNCTDWCIDGFKYASSLIAYCEKLILLSQISFFKPFANLYVDWEHHLWNLREEAKYNYDFVVTLSQFQNELWKAAGWKTVCADWLNGALCREPITKLVICAAHWNKNKNFDEIFAKAVELSKYFDPVKLDIESHSLDDNPATPDEMFKPGVLYFHSSKTDVNPMTIHEASMRGALVAVEDFPGFENLKRVLDPRKVIPIEQFSQDVLTDYYDLGPIEMLLKGTEVDDGTYDCQLTPADVMKELTAVMNSYAPKFSDIGYKCTKITGGNKK